MDQSKIKVTVGQTWVWVSTTITSPAFSTFKVEKVYTDKDGRRKADSVEMSGIILADDDCSGSWGELFNLKVEVGQVWVWVDTGKEYPITSLDTDIYGAVRAQSSTGAFFLLTKEGCLQDCYAGWTLKATIAEPTLTLQTPIVEGLNCDRCNDWCTMVESNRPGGKFRCYRCRH